MIHQQHNPADALKRALSPAHLEYPQTVGPSGAAAAQTSQPMLASVGERIGLSADRVYDLACRLEALASRAMGEQPAVAKPQEVRAITCPAGGVIADLHAGLDRVDALIEAACASTGRLSRIA